MVWMSHIYARKSNNRAECERSVQIHQKRLKMTVWNACVIRDDFSVINISQMIDQKNPRLS